MNQFENALEHMPGWVDELRPWIRPALIASATVTIVLIFIVAASKPVWHLLGAGRGFVPEGYYHVWGFVLMFGTVFGQALGWAGGTAIALYVMTLMGFPATWAVVRLTMSIIYVGLAVLPLSVYHFLYGGWLLDMPRVGLDEWLASNYPGARWLLIYAHPVIDYSLILLGAVFLGILWCFGQRVQRDAVLRAAVALALLMTSVAVALSVAIHSTLVHIRIDI